MNYYQFHIGDFNSATRHLNRLERSIYRDLIDLYYDSETGLPNDIQLICRKIVANECSTDVERVLNEFFTLVDDRWHNERCDAEIAKYKAKHQQQINAGQASAAKRNQSVTNKQRTISARSTGVQPTNNQEPITNNQNKDSSPKPAHADSGQQFRVELPQSVMTIQTNTGAEYGITAEMIEDWKKLYPAIDVEQQLRNMKGWVLANPTKRKTLSGIPRFITNWLAREQNAGPRQAIGARAQSNDPGTEMLWTEFRRCNGNGTVSQDARVQHAVRLMGGWSRLGEMSSFDLNKRRDDFDRHVREYRDAA